jgi:hypothetical protein
MALETEKACCACGTNIPAAAELCASCKTYQRRWKSRLQFFSSMTALLVASVSLLAWTLSQLPKLRAQLFPRTQLVVISCNSLEGGVVANLGDEEVFVSHVLLFNTGSEHWVGQRFPINESLAPNGFLKVASPWDKTFQKGTWVRSVSAHELAALVDKAAALDSPCVRMVLFAQNDPMYEELTKAGGPTLNTITSHRLS